MVREVALLNSIGQVSYITAFGSGSSTGFLITQGLQQPCLSFNVTLGPDMNILYGALGYNGCRTLIPSITGAVGPFTYSWMSTDANANGSTAASLAVCILLIPAILIL